MKFEDELKRLIKTGKIRKTLPDKVDVKFIRLLVHSLQWVSVGYSSALYFAGKKLGKEVISQEIKGSDLKKILEEIGNFFQKYGIGKLEIKDMKDPKNVDKTVDELKQMSRAQQMKYVEKLFDKVKLPQGASAGQIYAHIFLPGRAKKSNILTTSGEGYYKWNKGLDLDKDGDISGISYNEPAKHLLPNKK